MIRPTIGWTQSIGRAHELSPGHGRNCSDPRIAGSAVPAAEHNYRKLLVQRKVYPGCAVLNWAQLNSAFWNKTRTLSVDETLLMRRRFRSVSKAYSGIVAQTGAAVEWVANDTLLGDGNAPTTNGYPLFKHPFVGFGDIMEPYTYKYNYDPRGPNGYTLPQLTDNPFVSSYVNPTFGHPDPYGYYVPIITYTVTVDEFSEQDFGEDLQTCCTRLNARNFYETEWSDIEEIDPVTGLPDRAYVSSERFDEYDPGGTTLPYFYWLDTTNPFAFSGGPSAEVAQPQEATFAHGSLAHRISQAGNYSGEESYPIMSFWADPLWWHLYQRNGEKKYCILAAREAVRVDGRTYFFMADAHVKLDLNTTTTSFFDLYGVQIVSSGFLNPEESLEVGLPYTAGDEPVVLDGTNVSVGRVRFVILGETPAEWSARSGLSFTS